MEIGISSTTKNLIIKFGNIMFPMLTAEWLHLALYRISKFQREHYNSVFEIFS
jgi:hypothetical protein